jgi:hypothetical protein
MLRGFSIFIDIISRQARRGKFFSRNRDAGSECG